MVDCVAEWDKLLPHYAPFTGERIDDYVSENYDDCVLCSK